MSKMLIVAEKPSVAGDIVKVLGGGFERKSLYDATYYERDDIIVASCIGHLVQINCPQDQDPGSDLDRLPAIPHQFKLEAITRTEKALKLLGKLFSRDDVDTLVNACDAGREGELIFRYVYHYHDCNKPFNRMWLQSMTPAAILAEFANMQPGSTRDNLFFAALSRSESDWLIGVNGTRAVAALYARKNPGKRTHHAVGRVMTPVLYLVVQREEQIRTFVAKPFYEVHATFSDGQRTYKAKWRDPRFVADPLQPELKADRLFDLQLAQRVLAHCQNTQPTSVVDDTQDVESQPPLLFDLTTLQREANRKFGFSAKKTLDTAQKLYEIHKVTTYPRTDATALPEDYVETSARILAKLGETAHSFAQAAQAVAGAVKPTKRIFDNSKISDHFAIIPSGIFVQLEGDEAKLYELIARRFIAAFHPTCLQQRTTRTTTLNGQSFVCSGLVMKREGWRAIYVTVTEDDKKVTNDEKAALCALRPGEMLPNTGVAINKSETKAPPRYTEDTLLGAMEAAGKDIEDEAQREAMKGKGLGTPATRAATLEKLLGEKLSYLKRDGRSIESTPMGKEIIAFLMQNNLQLLLSPETTGEWEFRFGQMEKGLHDRETFMAKIHATCHQIVEKTRACAAALPPVAPPELLAIACPKCQGQLQSDAAVVSCGCGFKLWKTQFGKTLNSEHINTLLGKQQTPLLKGFVSTKKKGATFSAKVILDPEMSGKVTLVFQ